MRVSAYELNVCRSAGLLSPNGLAHSLMICTKGRRIGNISQYRLMRSVLRRPSRSFTLISHCKPFLGSTNLTDTGSKSTSHDTLQGYSPMGTFALGMHTTLLKPAFLNALPKAPMSEVRPPKCVPTYLLDSIRRVEAPAAVNIRLTDVLTSVTAAARRFNTSVTRSTIT